MPVRNEAGGMTLFTALTITSLLLLALALADVIRMRLAAVEMESDARRAARSMLSAFEPQLLEYGLFGTANDAARISDLLDAATGARLQARSERSFAWYKSGPGAPSMTLEPLYDLGDHRVFHMQMLERMKYLAPIEFGLGVVQKLNVGRRRLEQARKFAERSAAMEEALQRRDEALDRAWISAQRLAHAAGTEFGGDTLQPQLSALQSELEEASRANADIRAEQEGAPAAGGAGESEAELPPVSVYPLDYFTEYVVGAASVASIHHAWRRSAASAAAGEREEAEDKEGEPRSEAGRLRNEAMEAASIWLASRRARETERERERRENRRWEEEKRRNAEEELARRRDPWEGFCTADTSGDYAMLSGPNGLYEKYREYNEHFASGGIAPAGDGVRNADAFLSASFGFLDAIMQAAEGFRDETYLNEYALTHFTFRSPVDSEAAVQWNAGAGSLGLHRLQGQEAEFILYGLPSCHLNLSAMHAELFALRTGLRTLEALTKPQAAARAASPLIALLSALAEGAKQANDDVERMLAGEAVELPFVPGVTVTYKDHLRLFYLLHSRDESKLSRMQALIELNTGIDLTKRYTAIRVRSETTSGGVLLPGRAVRADVVVSY